MKTSDFDFNLPEELIAQTPLNKRDSSKMLVLDKQSGKISHQHFNDIINYFDESDCLVLNETKVIPARLFGKKQITNANIEVLLLKNLEENHWETLVKPAKRIDIGDIVVFSEQLQAKCISKAADGIRVFELIYDGILMEVLEQLGEMPLPPYITEKLTEKDRYQTVYAKNLGSAAAPTAGLHFTSELLTALEKKGVEVIKITLHVGLGTFRPVSVDDVNSHKMHYEAYFLSEETTNRLNAAILNKKRITAVGTTVIRTLESNFDGKFHSGSFETNIFIYPGYQFKVVDQLITNFHLPKSTLIMLVSAFSNFKNIMNAYQVAITNKYRFFSFGDAMFLRKD